VCNTATHFGTYGQPAPIFIFVFELQKKPSKESYLLLSCGNLESTNKTGSVRTNNCKCHVNNIQGN
jgi:hypothetical protein